MIFVVGDFQMCGLFHTENRHNSMREHSSDQEIDRLVSQSSVSDLLKSILMRCANLTFNDSESIIVDSSIPDFKRAVHSWFYI